MPPAIPLWADALKAVDTDSRRIVQHPNKGLLTGYQFPDPHIFLPEGRQMAYLSAWLSCRAGWVQSVVSNCAELPVPKTQQWRDFLFQKAISVNPAKALSPPLMRPTPVLAASASRHRSAAHKASKARRREKLEASSNEIFTLRLATTSVPKELFWNGTKVLDGKVNMLTPAVTLEIVWDLYEHNFRLELLALDHCVMAESWRDPMKATIRDSLLRGVFPGDGGFLVGAMPTSNQGLAAERWEDRLPFVENLRMLMSDWPGHSAVKLKGIKVFNPSFAPTCSYVEEVERILAPFYCQTFFDFFGRAAITPHRIPLSSALPSSSAL
jgi:hypothetical protein